jgi:hypothetical protein
VLAALPKVPEAPPSSATSSNIRFSGSCRSWGPAPIADWLKDSIARTRDGLLRRRTALGCRHGNWRRRCCVPCWPSSGRHLRRLVTVRSSLLRREPARGHGSSGPIAASTPTRRRSSPTHQPCRCSSSTHARMLCTRSPCFLEVVLSCGGALGLGVGLNRKCPRRLFRVPRGAPGGPRDFSRSPRRSAWTSLLRGEQERDLLHTALQ